MACSSCGKRRRGRRLKRKQRFNIAAPTLVDSPSADAIREMFRAQEDTGKPPVDPGQLTLLKNRDAI